MKHNYDENHIMVAASVIAADPLNIGHEVRAAEAAGADVLHLDVMDGVFVPNITFGADMCRAICSHTVIPVEIHLMICQAADYIDVFAATGAQTLIVHTEAVQHLDGTLRRIRNAGCRAGVALNPATPDSVLEYVADLIDHVCVMTVNPGFGGQKFLPGQIMKVEKVRNKFADKRITIEVDGGVTKDTAPLCINAGACVLVAGSSVFRGKEEDYADNIMALRNKNPD